MHAFATVDFFADIEDPRVERTRRHKLTDVLLLALIGTVSGHSGWDDMVGYAEEYEEELRDILELPHGIPSADTIRRVLSSLNPAALEAALTAWAKSLCGSLEGKHIAIDGKSVRGSFVGPEGTGALHLVHAWVCENQMLLAQRATDVKSNEITAIPELLKLMNLKKSVVTIDAIGCQTEIAKAVIDAKGDYVFGLKGNQPTLHEEVLSAFDPATCEKLRASAKTFFDSSDKAHGRLERRRVYCLRDVDWLAQSAKWPSLRTLVLVESERTRLGITSNERRVYIASLDASAERFATVIREHWHVENKLHWVLDVTFSEDRCRYAKRRGTHAIAVLRRVALQLLKNVKTKKPKSLAMKRKLAGWRFARLVEALTAGISGN